MIGLRPEDPVPSDPLVGGTVQGEIKIRHEGEVGAAREMLQPDVERLGDGGGWLACMQIRPGENVISTDATMKSK